MGYDDAAMLRQPNHDNHDENVSILHLSQSCLLNDLCLVYV